MTFHPLIFSVCMYTVQIFHKREENCFSGHVRTFLSISGNKICMSNEHQRTDSKFVRGIKYMIITVGRPCEL